MNFEIPVGEVGDCYDRYLVRLAEMRESIKIMHQCLNELPTGPVKFADTKLVQPSREEAKSSMEAIIHHFK
jgi:NADH-quinone oxidoreductase subunit D